MLCCIVLSFAFVFIFDLSCVFMASHVLSCMCIASCLVLSCALSSHIISWYIDIQDDTRQDTHHNNRGGMGCQGWNYRQHNKAQRSKLKHTITHRTETQTRRNAPTTHSKRRGVERQEIEIHCIGFVLFWSRKKARHLQKTKPFMWTYGRRRRVVYIQETRL